MEGTHASSAWPAFAARPSELPRQSHSLKEQLERELHDPRRIRRSVTTAKRGAIDVSIRQKKLGVVESVEEFGAELQIHSFLDQRVFQQRDVPVVQTGSGEESAPRSSQCPQSLWAEQGSIEVRLPRAGIGDVERTRSEVRSVHRKRDCAGAAGAEQ